MKKLVIFISIVLGVVSVINGWQDEELFYSQVKPNIVVIFDTSGSMAEIIKYPINGIDGIPAGQPGDNPSDVGYDLSTSYSGAFYHWSYYNPYYSSSNLAHTRSDSVWMVRWVNEEQTIAHIVPESSSNKTRILAEDLTPPTGYSNGWRVENTGYNFVVGETIVLMEKRDYKNGAIVTLKNTYLKSGNLYFELDMDTMIGGPFTADNTSYQEFQRNPGWTPRIVKLYGTTFSDGNSAGYTQYGPEKASNYYRWLFLHATDAQLEGVSHFCDYGTFDVNDIDADTGAPNFYKNAWTRVQVARQAIEDIVIGFKDKVQMGLFRFNGSSGARVGSTTIDGTTVRSWVKDMADDTDRDNLIQIVRSFNASGNTPLAESLAETWRYFQGEDDWYSGYGTYTSPCDFHCRRNFVVFMTDGEPTADDSFRTVTDKDEGSHDYCYDWVNAPADDSDLTTTYRRLANTAWFMFNNDARPDIPEVQNIETYTIGFTTTGNTNRLLENTATNGGGSFYLANNSRELVTAFEEIFGKIYEKSTSFAQFAAPKQSAASGKRGYIATFIPKNNKALWEGHLKCYRLNDNGDFEVDVNGNVNESPIPPSDGWMYWDAGLLLKAREADDRDIFTWINGVKVDFTTDNVSDSGPITPAMLGMTTEAGGKALVDIVRGKTDPWNYRYPIDSTGTDRWKLGDIFHFTPQVVGVPIKAKADSGAFPGYKDFYDYYSGDDNGSYPDNDPRKEVIYVGANDGMLHCFQVEDGEELWAFIPPSCLKSLAIFLDSEQNHDYFVDGKGLVEDIRIGTGITYQDWKTILVFGLGLGGSSYYAMDITNPDDPSMRWEIGVANHGSNVGKTVIFNPNGSETVVAADALLGYTEDRPALGDINYSPNPIPVTALSGGHDTDELAATANKLGKSLFVLHAYDATMIKGFWYNSTDSHQDEKWLDSSFLYSMPSGPIMLDKNNNRLADSIYQADIGGRLWKIDVTSSDTGNWLPEIIFNTAASITNGLSTQALFISPTFGVDSDYNLWVFIGSGQRSSPNDQSSIGKMYIFKDDNAHPSGGYTPGNLQNITTFFQDHQDNFDRDLDGYPDAQELAADTDINDPLDYPEGSSWDTPLTITDPDGFYFNFFRGSTAGAAGEKLFDPKPIFLNSQLIFNTYVPPVTGGGEFDPCNPGGSLYIYTFRMSTSQNETTIQNTDVTEGRIVGTGVLSGGKSMVYIGGEKIGSTQLKDQLDIDLNQLFGREIWVERKR